MQKRRDRQKKQKSKGTSVVEHIEEISVGWRIIKVIPLLLDANKPFGRDQPEWQTTFVW